MKLPRPLIFAAFLFSLSLHALPLSDSAGLTMNIDSTGVVSGVALNGTSLPSGTGGGFFLRTPNSSAQVPMTGSAASTNGVLTLNLTSDALNASVTATLTPGVGFIEVSGTLTNLDPINNPDRGLWLGFNLPVNTVGWNWGHNLTAANQVITSTAPGYSGDDRLLIPIPAVWSTNGGIALCIPPTDPCVFENSADANGVRILMAFGLSTITTNFPSKAPFRFRIYSIDGTWGFRDALAKYYNWYPDYYAIDPSVMKRLNYNRFWFTENYENEGPTTNDLANLVFPEMGQWCAYTKLTARPAGMTGVENNDPAKTQGYLDAIATCTDIMHYQRKGITSADPSLVEARAAISNCVAYHPDGTWSMQVAPALGTLDIGCNTSPNLFKDAAHPNWSVYGDMYLRRPGKLLGFNSNFAYMHWDVTGGRSLIVNYRRDHFTYTAHPLTFDQYQPVRLCLPTQFTNYELFDAFRLQSKQGGMFHEGAGMQDFGAKNATELLGGQDRVGMHFLSSVLASAWNEGGENYHALGEYDEYRIFMGRKSYRIAWSYPGPGTDVLASVKRALANATAFGFASCPDSTYFYPTSNPNYDPNISLFYTPAHQALWTNYITASEAIRLAGWEPVTHAYSSSSAVEVQRFGNGQTIYLTVWGPTNLPATVDIDIEAAALGLAANPTFSEIVSNTPLTVVPSTRGWKLTVPMEQDMTRVIKITNPTVVVAPFAASSSWTCPAGVTSVTAECWGGGGAGGAAFRNTVSGTNTTGGGGAGGAYAKKVISGLIPNNTYTVTVGAGGVSVAGAADGTSVPGGDSWFNSASTVLAKGGAGGVARKGAGLVGSGGVGSTAGSIGDVLFAGGSGSSGTGATSGGGGGGSAGSAITGITAAGFTGAAAVTNGGPGGNGTTTIANGFAPVSGPGGGGGGARANNATKAGGAGSPGQVVLTFTSGSPAPLNYTAWATQYHIVQGPTGDDDGDGQSNYFEFVAGLDPTNPNSVFTVQIAPVTGQPTQMAISFSPIVSGRTYKVESTTNLASGTWTGLSGSTTSYVGTVRTVTDTGPIGAKKFYRVVISAP
jgi:hypothetical protein